MSKKLPCYIVKDMLPLYADDLLSQESMNDVKEHLEECSDCSALYRQMTSPEPEVAEDVPEVDYLKKINKGRKNLLICAVLIVALIAAAAFINSRIQATKATFNFDEASKTLVIYGKNDTDIKIPKTIHEATELDAQFDTFHLKVHLPFLRNGDTVLEEYIPAYLGRTNESLRFLRDYLKEHSNNEDLIKRAEKFVDLSITDIDDYTWSEQYDRIELKVGDYYWHREEVYVLSLLGKKSVQWKQLGYAWYVGTCIDPYNETINMNFLENLKELPYYDIYSRGGGTDEISPENYRILSDAAAYICLSEGMYWGGTAYESIPLKLTALYSGPTKVSDPGDEMSVCMATSFIAYLSDQYGFDIVSEFCFSDKTFDEAFGTDYQTAYDDWCSWIIGTYGV
jgi:hypothetical protein